MNENSSDFYIFICPHCKEEIIVIKKELNCRIFRHGIYKNNYQQVNPHASFDECKYLIENNLIFGCGKPFEVVEHNNSLIAVVCEYK
jgi:hypothetical protein